MAHSQLFSFYFRHIFSFFTNVKFICIHHWLINLPSFIVSTKLQAWWGNSLVKMRQEIKKLYLVYKFLGLSWIIKEFWVLIGSWVPIGSWVLIESWVYVRSWVPFFRYADLAAPVLFFFLPIIELNKGMLS